MTFGAYKLPQFLVKSINNDQPVNVSLSPELIAEFDQTITPAQTAASDSVGAEKPSYVHVSGNEVYLGRGGAAQIGDVRITFTKVMPQEVSVMAKAQGNTFGRFVAKNGKTFAEIRCGNVSAQEIIQQEKDENTMWTWVLRILGVVLVCTGLKMMFEFLTTWTAFLPFLRQILSAGVGLVCSIGGFVWSVVVIALAWLFYRPVLGMALLIVAGAGIWYLRKRAQEKKSAQASPVSEAAPMQPAMAGGAPVPPATPEVAESSQAPSSPDDEAEEFRRFQQWKRQQQQQKQKQ